MWDESGLPLEAFPAGLGLKGAQVCRRPLLTPLPAVPLFLLGHTLSLRARLRYERDKTLEEAVRCVARSLGLTYIDPERLYVIRSYGSRSRAIARIYMMPSAWRFALNMGPVYLIEFISERFDRLTPMGKAEVIVHELLHIPPAFSGGLRPHGRLVNDGLARRLTSRVDESCLRLLGGHGEGGSVVT